MKILITGASGMVGCNLLAVSDFVEQHDFLTPTSKELNLLDQAAVNEYFNQHKPDMVIHLAAKVGGIQANINEPVEFLANNILMSTLVIKAALSVGVKKFINLGSSCMYPKDRELLIEDDLLTGSLEPTNEGYAIAKSAAAFLCRYISRQYSYHYKTIIPCNLYGPYDNFDLVTSHMVAAAIRKVHEAKVNQEESVVIWGNGEVRREILYAGDLADFIFLAVDNLERFPEIVNVGLGRDYTINEYYKIMANVIGFSGRFEHDLNKASGMQKKLMDHAKSRQLGWMPKTSIEEGVRKTYQFYLSQL